MKGSVLVADGDEENRSLISKELSNSGYEVTEISDGAKALKLVEGKSWRWIPKFILVDSLLSGVSAFELLRRLSEKYEGKETVIILTSKFRSPEDEVEGLNAGAAGYLVKPFSISDIEAIEARVQEKRKRISQSL
jgi:DNA-binding response OmpR family regulator